MLPRLRHDGVVRAAAAPGRVDGDVNHPGRFAEDVARSVLERLDELGQVKIVSVCSGHSELLFFNRLLVLAHQGDDHLLAFPWPPRGEFGQAVPALRGLSVIDALLTRLGDHDLIQRR